MTENLRQPDEIHPLAERAGVAIVALEAGPRADHAASVVAAIDPEGQLPEVEIIPDPDARVGRGSLVPQKSLIIHDGVTIGRCTLTSDNKGKARWFNGIEVDGAHRGRGFGSAAYKAAIGQAMRDGYDFTNHEWSQTPDSKRVWDRLEAQGVARAIEPFQPDGRGKFNGKYIIDALK